MQDYGVWKKSGSSVMKKWMDLELELTGVGNGSDIVLEGKQRIIDDAYISGACEWMVVPCTVVGKCRTSK